MCISDLKDFQGLLDEKQGDMKVMSWVLYSMPGHKAWRINLCV